ncbi:MAG: hypothetical protein AVDCRST_MAG68-5729 [uncultured Gemmatimonadetes bacterium]|uniref:Trypsin-like peptidase domain-containing protein n=1 Tax=uncultured Gemmatimonadota bacterium TaxID=203437 RepID=A0A6J4MWD9_9BACT|nr:MAG: hypothetical protein AVDCRST_MAG68-5729 [uncultured Gemmatimonadota bacterium]
MWNKARSRIPAAQAEMKVFTPAVRPLYTVSSREKPDAEGSCVLFKVGGRHFLLTAAHVLDQLMEGELYIGGDESLLTIPRNWHGTQMPDSGNREDDKIDLAFMELPAELVAEMGDCLWLGPRDVVQPGSAAAHRFYCTFGYPVRRAKVRSQVLSVAAPADLYAGVAVDQEVYERLGLSPETHIVISYDRERVISSHGVRVPTVKPYGKSGGGLWRFDSLVVPGLPPLENPLAGILTEWRREEKVLVATRIELFVALLKREFPGAFH